MHGICANAKCVDCVTRMGVVDIETEVYFAPSMLLLTSGVESFACQCVEHVANIYIVLYVSTVLLKSVRSTF